jgi:hypothetical protein
VGLCVVRCLVPACAAMLLVVIVAGRASGDISERRSWRWPSPGNVARARILKQLEASGGKHLVFVRYGLSHNLGEEWVYNGADIDQSPVVWARELDRGSNAGLMRYFGDRRVWLVAPDAPPARLTPYSDAPPRPMPFVQLGAPGIAVLRWVDEVRRSVLAAVGGDENSPRTCDVWNVEFRAATVVEGPDVTGCFAAGERDRPVSFEHWFEWLKWQR